MPRSNKTGHGNALRPTSRPKNFQLAVGTHVFDDNQQMTVCASVRFCSPRSLRITNPRTSWVGRIRYFLLKHSPTCYACLLIGGCLIYGLFLAFWLYHLLMIDGGICTCTCCMSWPPKFPSQVSTQRRSHSITLIPIRGREEALDIKSQAT